MGLFKKVVVADSFALWANAGFATAHTLTFVDAWATSLSYTFQIYFDFCGYTDMAIGSALLFNIRLPANFNSPYKALNIQDFWQRWHITLGRFLRDYIYIPLGGNRHGNIKTSINILITFFIAGLWHGAGWTFILWGCLHGLAIVVYRLWKMFGYTMNTVFAWIITFNFINISWVLFRAEDWTKALSIAKAMMRIDKMIISHSFQTVYMNTLYKLSDLFPLISAVDKGHFIFSFDTYFWILLTTYITLTMKNSIELVDGCTANHTSDETKLAFIYGALFFGAIIKMMMCPYTDFLYFDF
jgi:D-alanyl-lipoteichoic acid acyltransferase DltB (MBOAT superfamily)